MADIYRYRLRKKFPTIQRDLEPRKILPYLYQEEVFDLDDMDEVKAEKTRKKQAEALLEKLMRSGPEAMRVLVKALHEKQPHLALLMETPSAGENAVNYANIEIDKELHQAKSTLETLHFELASSGKPNSPVEHNSLTKACPTYIGSTEKGAICTVSSEDQYWVKPTDPRLLECIDSDSVYTMKCNPHGFAILVNINKFDSSSPELEERTGSTKDHEDLEWLFQNLGYVVRSPKNLTKEGLKRELKKYVDEIKCSKVPHDSVVIFLMSHGENDFIFCSDGEKLAVEEVRGLFGNDNCDPLAGKPKLIFVQACRGKLRDQGLICRDGPGETTDEPWSTQTKDKKKMVLHFDAPKDTVPCAADVLVAFSSVSGHTSFRNPSNGSRFVRKLVEVFRKEAGSQDVLSMMTVINNEVSKMGDFSSKQIPAPVTTLRKKVYFWPGLDTVL